MLTLDCHMHNQNASHSPALWPTYHSSIPEGQYERRSCDHVAAADDFEHETHWAECGFEVSWRPLRCTDTNAFIVIDLTTDGTFSMVYSVFFFRLVWKAFLAESPTLEKWLAKAGNKWNRATYSHSPSIKPTHEGATRWPWSFAMISMWPPHWTLHSSEQGST